MLVSMMSRRRAARRDNMGNKSKCNGQKQDTKWTPGLGRGPRHIVLAPRWRGLKEPSLTTWATRLVVDPSLVGLQGVRVRHFREALPGRRVR